MLMIIQGCKFWCLCKKQISYLLLQEGFTVNAIDLNVDDSEGNQDNGFDSLEDYASDKIMHQTIPMMHDDSFPNV